MKGVTTTPKRTFDPDAPYQGINGAARISGLSPGAIRVGCKVGKIPHIMVGAEYRACMPLFLQQLQEQAEASLKGVKA